MGFDRGSLTVSRFLVEGPAPDFFADGFLDGIHAHRFRERFDLNECEENIGWITVDNLFDTEFSLDKVTQNQFVRLAVRVDRKSVPASLVKAHVQIEEAAHRAETGRTRLSAAVKREIAEGVRARLLEETPPKSASVELVWDTARDECFVASHAEKMTGHVADLMQRTFGVELNPAVPALLAGRITLEPEHIETLDEGVEPADFSPRAAAAEPLPHIAVAADPDQIGESPLADLEAMLATSATDASNDDDVADEEKAEPPIVDDAASEAEPTSAIDATATSDDDCDSAAAAA